MKKVYMDISKKGVEGMPKLITVKLKGKPSKYHRSRLKLNKDGSITIYE
jgi:hypothetical protein